VPDSSSFPFFRSTRANQERYRAITSSYYRGAVGALLVFDITKPKSFQNLSKWLEELGNHADPATIIGIVGNKSDLEAQRRVSVQEAEEFARLNRLLYFETSAKDAKNIDEGLIFRCWPHVSMLMCMVPVI
jgi:small GTP-binding protein